MTNFINNDIMKLFSKGGQENRKGLQTMKFKDLVEYIAADFAESIRGADCKNFKEMADLCWMNSKDIKEDIMACIHEANNEAYKKGESFEVDYTDDGEVEDTQNGVTYTYRQFKKMVVDRANEIVEAENKPVFDDEEEFGCLTYGAGEEDKETTVRLSIDFSEEDKESLLKVASILDRLYAMSEENNIWTYWSNSEEGICYPDINKALMVVSFLAKERGIYGE